VVVAADGARGRYSSRTFLAATDASAANTMSSSSFFMVAG
jgi:hypothetical protein